METTETASAGTQEVVTDATVAETSEVTVVTTEAPSVAAPRTSKKKQPQTKAEPVNSDELGFVIVDY
jgi:hypothetical protein